MMMLGKRLACLVPSLVLLAFAPEPGSCFEIDTHRLLNSTAINQRIGEEYSDNSFRLDRYLEYPLGFNTSHSYDVWGRNSNITWPMVQEWIKEGGVSEDDSPRYINHSHDPLRSWDQAGIRILGYPLFSSSVVWAQLEKGAQYQGAYSWHDAREYYYLALSAATPAQSIEWFRKTFRALGQIMHLVEDAAVPDHTRNDFWHGPQAYFFNTTTFERWTDRNRGAFSSLPVPTFTREEADQILGQKGDDQAPVPISRLFDRNLYLPGDRPNITGSTYAGIAEYSNSNFLSAATVFEGYTYPSLESTEPVAGTSYLRKARDGEVIERFVRTNEYKDNERYFLDPVCYRDYANQLIPKAAAYASLVPYYFFRAALNVSLVHQPGSLLYYNVLRVANCSSEPMINGQMDVYNDLYTYGTNQQLVGTYTIGYLPPAGRDGFFRCMGPPYVEIILPIAGWGTTSAVFRGTLGLEEEDAVVGSNYEFCCPA